MHFRIQLFEFALDSLNVLQFLNNVKSYCIRIFSRWKFQQRRQYSRDWKMRILLFNRSSLQLYWIVSCCSCCFACILQCLSCSISLLSIASSAEFWGNVGALWKRAERILLWALRNLKKPSSSLEPLQLQKISEAHIVCHAENCIAYPG